MSIKITIDKNAVRARLEAANEKALAKAASQALTDCNEFCPEDQGVLINSSYTHSDLKKGLLVWSTPYARFQYYGVVMIGSKSKSPWAKEGEIKVVTSKKLKYTKKSARKLWCEKAKIRYNESWRKIYENALLEEL